MDYNIYMAEENKIITYLIDPDTGTLQPIRIPSCIPENIGAIERDIDVRREE